MKTTYEVRFTLYHYNSGDGKNGCYKHKESFSTSSEAELFLSDYCWDGFLKSVDGIYEIIERKLT